MEPEDWKDHKLEGQQRRARNRDFSPKILAEAGLRYDERNGGAHLIVYVKGKPKVDFWPGTGLWMIRGSQKKARGVRELIARCREMEAAG